jgi:hypothetical protein
VSFSTSSSGREDKTCGERVIINCGGEELVLLSGENVEWDREYPRRL